MIINCDKCKNVKLVQDKQIPTFMIAKCKVNDKWYLSDQKNIDNNCLDFKKKTFSFKVESKKEIKEHKVNYTVEEFGNIKDCLYCGCLIVGDEDYCNKCKPKKKWWKFWVKEKN